MEDIDDDFGDLYADVEFQASTIINGISSNDDFETEFVNSDSKEVDEAKRASSECVREVGADVDGSDSEDELNIVLNDDNDGGGGGPGVSVSRGVSLGSGGGFDEDEEEGGGFEVVGEGDDGLVKNRSSSDGLELSPNDRRRRGRERANGSNGGYQSRYLQYKYMRHRGASFPANAKSNGCRGDWDDNKCSLRMDSSSLTAQIGHNFSLPRYRTILDVNIGALERKSWRHPEADITDFFNFGFSEESWKVYCNSVEQLRQRTSLLIRAPTCRYPKAKEVYDAESEYETGAHMYEPVKVAHLQGAVSPGSRSAYREGKQFGMTKGRVIQVEDCILERHPSMDGRRVVDRDPDVVIQIAVQDCADNSSGSGKEESTHKGSVRESSENGDFGMDDGIWNFGGGSGDELCGKLLEGDVKRSGRPYPKRYSQLSTPSNPVLVDFDNHASGQTSDVDVDGCHDQKVTGSGSEGQAEAMETLINTNEKVCSETCNAALSLGETDSLLGEEIQQETSSSISVSHVEALGNFASAYPERVKNHPRKQSPKSVDELHESLTSDCYQSIKSKSHQSKAKNRDDKYYSRNRSPFPKDRRNYIRRLHDDSELKRRHDYEESRPFPRTDDAYYKTLQGVYSYGGEGFPYYTGSELPCNYFGEWFSYNEAHAAYPKRSRMNHRSFEDEKDQYPSRRWEDREHAFKQRGSKLDEVVGRDWYHNENGITRNPLFHKNLRRLGPNYSSCSDKGSTRWRKGDEFHFRKRIREDDYLLDSNYEDYFMQEKYGYYGQERKYLHGKYERRWPSTMRGGKIPRRHFSRGRHTANRGRGFEAISRRSAYDLRLTERYGEHSRRQIVKQKNEGGDCFGSNHVAADSEGRVYYPGGEVHYERRQWQYDSFHYSRDDYVYSYEDDEFLAEEASFSSGRTLRSASAGGKQKLMDKMEIEQRRIKLMRGGSSNNRIERSSNITDRRNCEKPLLRCRDSVDLQFVGGEGKSSGRCSNAGSIKCNDKLENIDQMVFADRSESHAEKADETKNSIVEINQNEEQWLDKFPITEQNEDLDIEEGQIVTEEVNENPPCENFGSEFGAEIRDDKKKSQLVENATKGNEVTEGYDNARILAVMAKMEKRRERFKDPITVQKENDLMIPMPQVDPIVETMETKQHRPARKRRWGGS